jgi:hypothetical protein
MRQFEQTTSPSPSWCQSAGFVMDEGLAVVSHITVRTCADAQSILTPLERAA